MCGGKRVGTGGMSRSWKLEGRGRGGFRFGGRDGEA
jgi:hypothetical protein